MPHEASRDRISGDGHTLRVPPRLKPCPEFPSGTGGLPCHFPIRVHSRVFAVHIFIETLGGRCLSTDMFPIALATGEGLAKAGDRG